MSEKYIAFFLIGFFVFLCSFFLCPIVITIAKKTGFVSKVQEERFNKKAKPLLGGVAIFLAFWIGILFFQMTFKG